MRYVAEVTAANDGQVEARTITSALINSSGRRIPMSARATKWSRGLPKLRECLTTKGAVRADSIHVLCASGIGHRQPRRPPAPYTNAGVDPAFTRDVLVAKSATPLGAWGHTECRRRVKTDPPPPLERTDPLGGSAGSSGVLLKARRVSDERKGGERGGRGGAVGRAATRAFRRGQVDQASWRARRGCRATRSGGRCSSETPPRYRRAPRRAKLDPFKAGDPSAAAPRTRSCRGCGSASCWSRWGARRARRSSMTICARCGRCSRRRRRTFQRTVYRPGRGLPVRCVAAARARCRSGTARRAGAGSWSRAWATRARARACWCSRKQTEDLLAGIAGCLTRLGGVAAGRWSGIARPGIHGHGGRPDGGVRRRSAASCGSAGGSASPPTRRPRARSSGCRATRRRNFEPGRAFANELDFQDQLDAWFAQGQRAHAQDAARPAGRPAASQEQRGDGARCPSEMPDTDRRWVIRVAAGPAICASTPTTTRWTPRWSAGASRSASTSSRSSRSRWTPASWPAATRACSPGTGRSPRSSTPAR